MQTNHTLVHVPGIYCHIRASFTRACAFVYFTERVEYSSTLPLFQAQHVQKQE